MHGKACLLRHPSRDGFIEAKDVELEEGYLHYSVEEMKWIRSRKAVGCDDSNNEIINRNVEGHEKKAASASARRGVFLYNIPIQIKYKSAP